MLSDVEDELAEEIRRLRALLHRERRARQQRIEINQLIADTSGEVTREGVAETIVGSAGEILSAGWASVAYAADDDTMHFVHGPELPADVAARWTDVPLDLDIPMSAVLRGDLARVDLSDRAAMDRWPLLAAEAEAAGMASFVAWPISSDVTPHAPAAVLALAWPTPHVMDGEEQALLREMIAVAAPAFERARRTEVDRLVADTLQLFLLPSRVPDVESLEILTLYAPGRDEMAVGGDWYDVVVLDDERTAIVVGDVVGHDIRAAAEMGQVRHVLASHLLSTGDVGTSLAVTDRYFAARAIDTMATALVVVFDHRTGRLVIGSAGHLPPVVADLGTAARPVDCGLGPPLGSGLGGYRTLERSFPRESILVAFTDGVVERRGEPIDDSIAALCRHLDEVIESGRAGTARPLSVVRIRESLRRRTEDPWRRDDAAAVVVRHRRTGVSDGSQGVRPAPPPAAAPHPDG